LYSTSFLDPPTTMPAHSISSCLFFPFPLFLIFFFHLHRSRRSTSISPMVAPVALLALFAFLTAVLGLVKNAWNAQQVVHSLLATTTGFAILHLLVLTSRPKFTLYAFLVLPATLLFSGNIFLHFYLLLLNIFSSNPPRCHNALHWRKTSHSCYSFSYIHTIYSPPYRLPSS
jgi:hypothetical protein